MCFASEATAAISKSASEATSALADAAMIDEADVANTFESINESSRKVAKAADAASSVANSVAKRSMVTAKYILFGRKASDMEDGDYETCMSNKLTWKEPNASAITSQPKTQMMTESETADCTIDSPRSTNAAVLDLDDTGGPIRRSSKSVDIDRFEYI